MATDSPELNLDVLNLPAAPEVYLKNVARRWRRQIRIAKRVLLFSPYLTSKIAEAVVETVPSDGCEVYTMFSAANFASGASVLQTLRNLKAKGCSLYDLPKLHAKLILVPGTFASIGSQNVTSGGTQNKEATAVFTDSETINRISELTECWIKERRTITANMIDNMEKAIQPLILRMKKARRACKLLDEQVWELERSRAEKLEEDKRRQREDFAERLRRSKDKLQVYLGESVVSRETARELIRESIWWLTHPSGPVRAPAYQHRLRDGLYGWHLTLGANTFHVALAAKRCAKILDAWIAKELAGQQPSFPDLRINLCRQLDRSVSNNKGGFFESYSQSYSELTFGATEINTSELIRSFLWMVGFPPGLIASI
jgi:hypothetical protein